jgi:CHAT domain-containing protein
LFQELVAPVIAVLPDANPWILSPDGVLWELPFHTLIAKDGRHLLETHALSYTPSLTALWAIRQRAQKIGSPPLELLAVGNPALPQAEDEVRRMARMHPTRKTVARTGGDARQDRFRDQAARAAIIHITTPARLNAANPLYFALSLTPGILSASEIVPMPLRARLAVLSACETGRGKIGARGGITGHGMGLGWRRRRPRRS